MAQREPCPDRILDDLGGAFAMGCVGGSIFYFIKGFYNSPSRERMIGAMRAIKNRGPLLGGSFGLWGLIFSTCDCSLLWYRGKESPFNAIISGTATGGILASKSGFKPAFRNAMAGGVILGIIELVSMAHGQIMAKQQMTMMHEISKLQEERQHRKMQGLPDFTPEELDQRLQSKLEQKGGFMKNLLKRA